MELQEHDEPSSNRVRHEGVILLHGLARTRRSMAPLAAFLKQRGYTVANAGYPSRRAPIEILAQSTLPPAVTAL